jgi:hypothetical protein
MAILPILALEKPMENRGSLWLPTTFLKIST